MGDAMKNSDQIALLRAEIETLKARIASLELRLQTQPTTTIPWYGPPTYVTTPAFATADAHAGGNHWLDKQ